jgi:hypothetical protein
METILVASLDMGKEREIDRPMRVVKGRFTLSES